MDWDVDLWIPEPDAVWHTIGWWFESPAPDGDAERGLHLWVDHRPLPDARYRVRYRHDTQPLATVDYRRTGPMPRYRRAPGDTAAAHECPLCGASTYAHSNRSAVIHGWCPQCERFADGCQRRATPGPLGYHAPVS